MLSLAQTLRQKFEQDIGSVNLPVLVKSLQEALNEKHLLVYVDDAVWGKFFFDKNWMGAVQPNPGDYLMVVDANLGFNKASTIVERQTNYQIALAADGSAQANVNLVYHHPAAKQNHECSPEPRYDPIYEQNMERCYWDYVRVMAPLGARLIGGPKVIVEGKYLLREQPTTGRIDQEYLGTDKISWGQLFLLPPQESLSLDYIYALPTGTAKFIDDHWEYNLYLQKQPGTMENPVELTIILPKEAQFLDSYPAPRHQTERGVTYQFNLKTDEQIHLSYAMP
jgi:hypothetical protein